jgi:MioC protein
MINIIVGTETGTAEFVADEVLELLTSNNIQACITLEPVLKQLIPSPLWIVITSTHGAGDIPYNLHQFTQSVTNSNSDLSSQKAMIIALGDSSYDTYCQAGISINDLFLSANMTMITPMLKVDAMDDDMPEDIVIEWLSQYIPSISDLI